MLWATAALVVIVGLGIWMLPGSTARSSPATVSATRGDVTMTVGGVGRIVEARATMQITVPSAATGGVAGASTSSSAAAASPPASAPADAVFPTASGRVARILVAPGQHVAAGQVVAILDDGSTAATAAAQARTDLAQARLELAQKLTHDPLNGPPPSAAELAAARLAVTAATTKLGSVLRPPRADVGAARLDVQKARVDLATLTRPPVPRVLQAARLAVEVARRALAQITGPPTRADVTAAELEVAKAQADLEAVKATAPPPSATAVEAAQLAVKLAEQRLAELPAGSPPSDVTAAQLEVKRAQADLESLTAAPPSPSATALAAAQLAVDAARQRLELLTGPPTALAVSTARLELRKAQGDLAAMQRPAGPVALAAAHRAVTLARERLGQLLHPSAAVRDGAKLEVAKARADLGTLRRRGGPATATDVAIARVKVRAALARLALATAQVSRLKVRAPSAGTLTSVLTVPGAPVDPTTPVVTVADLRRLAVIVDLSEFDAARVRRGQAATVRVDALGGKSFTGRVLFEALSGVDNGGVVTFPVRLGLSHAHGVKPGMNVSVRIVVARHQNVVQVPLAAVRHEGGRPVVTVAGASGGTATRHVVLGLAGANTIEVRHGLRAGERVLLGGSPGG